jgi:hypothetical protein
MEPRLTLNAMAIPTIRPKLRDYQTKIFKRDAFAVNYYAEIDSIGIAFPSKVPIDLSAS